VKSGGGSFATLYLQVGADWWTHLSTYEDHPPILSVDVGSTSVSVCLAGRKADDSAVEFARELARQAERFAADVERLHARQSTADEATEAPEAGNGEAA
jgi:hypothetical protein